MADRLKLLKAAIAAGLVASPEDAEALNAGPLAKKFKAQFSNLMDKKPRMEIDDSGAIVRPLTEENVGWGASRDLQVGNSTFSKLEQVLDHPELYENYPDLRNAFVRYKHGTSGGSYVKDEYGKHEINAPVALDKDGVPRIDRQTLLHEIQHAIQEKEGFARGGSPDAISYQQYRNPKYDEWAKINEQVVNDPVNIELSKITSSGKYHDEINAGNRLWREKYEERFKELEGMLKGVSSHDEGRPIFNKIDALMTEYKAETKGLFPLQERANELARVKRVAPPKPPEYLEPFDAYKRLAGEIESRDVADRAGLSAEERLRRAHYSPQGIPLDDVITRYRDMAAKQALQADPMIDPVSMVTAGVGIPRMAGKVAAAVADPVINYLMDIRQGNEEGGDILIGNTDRLMKARSRK